MTTATMVKSNKLANLQVDLAEARRNIVRLKASGATEMDRRVMRERVQEVMIINEIASIRGVQMI